MTIFLLVHLGFHYAKTIFSCFYVSVSFPVAMDKLDGPATILDFLGLQLDSVLQQICLPPAKVQDLMAELTH